MCWRYAQASQARRCTFAAPPLPLGPFLDLDCAITPDAVSTPWRVYLQHHHDHQFSADRDNLARDDNFLVSSNLSRHYQPWRQENIFWLFSHIPPIIDPHLPPPASNLQPTPKCILTSSWSPVLLPNI